MPEIESKGKFAEVKTEGGIIALIMTSLYIVNLAV